MEEKSNGSVQLQIFILSLVTLEPQFIHLILHQQSIGSFILKPAAAIMIVMKGLVMPTKNVPSSFGMVQLMVKLLEQVLPVIHGIDRCALVHHGLSKMIISLELNSVITLRCGVEMTLP